MKRLLSRIDKAEFAFLAAIFLVALFMFVGAFSFTGGAWIYPAFTSAITIICIIIYLIKVYRAAAPIEKKERTPEEQKAFKWEVQKLTITVAFFVGYILITYLAGFLIASAIIAVAYPLIFKYKKPLSIISSLVLNVGFVLIFQWFLGVPLSRGILLDLSWMFF